VRCRAVCQDGQWCFAFEFHHADASPWQPVVSLNNSSKTMWEQQAVTWERLKVLKNVMVGVEPWKGALASVGGQSYCCRVHCIANDACFFFCRLQALPQANACTSSTILSSCASAPTSLCLVRIPLDVSCLVFGACGWLGLCPSHHDVCCWLQVAPSRTLARSFTTRSTTAPP